ncbi:MAG: TonB-dependent receptor [Bryobacteraceae bacterium]
MKSILAFSAFTVTALLQAQTATIVGTVTDSTGGAVANVAVTVTSKDTGLARKTTTNSSGYYAASLLPTGAYTVSAEISGFKKKTVSDIVLEVNQQLRVDVQLEIGSTSDSVTVASDAIQLQTENATVGQVVDNQYTTQIPLNGRDFSQLLLLVPGATTRPGGYDQTVGSATGSLGSGVAIGGRDNQNNFQLDGASNNARQFGNIAVKPSIDAIQEFKVQTNSYSAELGQAAFGQISLITKSGTNEIHGALFEFLRNNAFDARNFFLPKPSRLNRNQFGGAAGGPVIRNKTFFFFNYEAHTERRGVESFRSVPVQAWREGDFSGVAGLTLKDPAAGGAPFAGNRIPATRFSQTAKASIGLWPAQNFGGPTTVSNNLLITAPDKYSNGLMTIKIDHELTSKDRINGKYTRAVHDETTTPGLPTFEQFIPPRNTVALINLTHIFSPAILGEFRASFTRSEFVQASTNTGKNGYYSQFGINNPLAGPQFEGAPSLTYTNIALTAFGDGDFNTQRDISNEFNYGGAISWTRGNHLIKSGFTLTRYQQNTPGPVTGLRRGSFNFRGDFTGQPFADFLLGVPYTASRVVGKGVETGRSWWHGYYVQDDWKVNRKLTFNIGLRYEYISPLADNLDRRSTFWPLSNDYNTNITPQVLVADPKYCATTTRACAGIGDVLHLDGISRRAAYRADRNNFAPRFGFAYSADSKTVIRGGYGIFFTNSQAFLNNFVINRRQPPFAETQQITSSTATPQINIADPFVSASAALVVGTQNINPDFKEGYTQQWNLTVQRELPWRFSLEAGYVANKGTALDELVFYNIPTPGPTATVQARRPFPGWGTALSMDPYVNSNYNSLQVKAVRRGGKGMSTLIAYTYAKSIDLSSERGSGDRGGGFSGSGNERDRARSSRGLSGFDVRQRLVLSSVYELPFGRGKSMLSNAGPVANKIVNGWEFSFIAQAQGGFPYTAAMSGDVNGDGITDRPDLVGPVTYQTRNPQCYVVDSRNPACNATTSAFVNLPTGVTRFGSAGRDILIGPGLAQVDFGAGKNTRFGKDDRFNLQFRWEAFNFFNRANFNQPAAVVNVASPAFGRITSAGRAREMQFGLKLTF